MIADPGKIGAGTLNAWARDADNRGLAAAVSNVAGEAPSAQGRAKQWTASRSEMVAYAGWHTLASIAKLDNDLPDSYFAEYLKTIESKVDGSPNWARYAMNNALICIGARNAKLEKKAIATARRIGKIEVDHGQTGCKTPDAAAYIKKVAAKRKASRQPFVNLAGAFDRGTTPRSS